MTRWLGSLPMRAASLVLAPVVVLFLVIACSDSPKPSTAASNATTSSTAATPSTAASATTSSSGATTLTTVSLGAACPTSVFPDLANVVGAGSSYAKPAVAVSCNATTITVTSNGMPSYAFVARTPNPLAPQDYSWSIPRAPKVAASPTTIKNRLGTLGFTVTGLPIYGPTEGAMPASEAFGDPVFNNILDDCKGHTGPGAEYHNHALRDVSVCGFTPSAVLGFALDGFPIYGPRGCLDTACTNVVTFVSGYKKTGDPKKNAWDAYTYQSSSDPTVLDACNGRIGPDGTYRYYATTAFPYTFGCYAGTPTAQAGRAAQAMPPMGPPGR